MKKIFLVSILFAFALISLVSADTSSVVNYTTNSNQGIVVTQLKYSPYPANPGEYIDLWVEAQISGALNPSNATFILNVQYPFSLDPSDSGVRSFGQLGSTPVVMHFKVRVDQNAVIGDNQLELDYSPSGLGSTNAWSVKMLDIQIANVQTSFDMVLQDSTSSEVSIAIANTGQNTANSMIVKIPEQKGFLITGTNGQMIGNLDAGDYTLVTFGITKEGTGTRNLTVEIDYTDSIGVRRQNFENVTFLSSSQTPGYAFLNGTTGAAVMGENVAAGTNFSPGGQFPGGTYRRSGNTTSWVVYVAIIAGAIVLLIIGLIIYRKNSKKIKEHFRKKKYQKDLQNKAKTEVNNSKSQQLPDWIRKVKESEKK